MPRLGKFLDRLGQYGLPLSVGLFLGFWAGDFGMSWLPDMLEVLSLTVLASICLILVGYRLRGKHVVDTPEGQRTRRRFLAFLLLVLVVAGFRLVVYWARTPTPLTTLDDETFERTFAEHRQQAHELYQQMDRLLERLEATELPTDDRERRPLRPDEEKLLRESWSASYDCAFALDQLRIFYEDWYRFDPSRAARSRLLRSYLLTFEAELSLFETSLRWVRLADRSREITRFLDAPHPEIGLGADTFSTFRQELQGTRDQARVVAGEAYMRWLESTLAPRGLEAPSSFRKLSGRIEERLRRIRSTGFFERLADTVKADTEILHRTVRRTWFPAQKGVAEWVGSIKTRRVGRYLITPAQYTAMDEHLEPGDVLLSRKNWHLTNVGLPGFWPHAILYLGDLPKFTAYFDDPAVRAWTTTRGAADLPALLRDQFPEVWRRYAQNHGHLDDAPGIEPVRVLEAVGEGVVLNTYAHALGDYVAALRPELDKVAKAQALFEAFSHVGKPYDYDFDFATDHALVCTEVVWRSYRPGPGKEGLDLPVSTVAGRLTLPANDIALWTAVPQTEPAMDFVYFMDAKEKEERAFVADEEAFLASGRRLKWDVLLD